MSLVTESDAASRRIHATLKRWKGDIAPDDRELFKAFVAEATLRIRGTFLAHHGSREVLERLELAFLHTRVRPSEQIKVAIVESPARGVIAISNMPDQPFIVDTMRLFTGRAGAEFLSGFNFVVRARRDADGHLVAVAEDDAPAESVVLMEIDGGDLGDLDVAARTLQGNLELARLVVRDFRPMTRLVDRWAARLESLADTEPMAGEAARETASFLRWLLNENFVFMGVEVTDGDALGIQTLPGPHAGSSDGDWPTPHPPGTVRVRKSLVESRVHRAGRIDEVLVSMPTPGDGSQLFLRGMFTYRAVTQPCRGVPILRAILKGILVDQSATPGSFRYKGIANVFDSLPTEFVFTASREDIAGMLDLVFDSEQRGEVGVTFLKTTRFTAFCLIAMPKAAYSEELRRDLERHTVKSLGATYSDHGLYMGRFDTVLVYFYLTGVEDPSETILDHLKGSLRDLATPWLARLWAALADEHGEEEAERLTEVYGRAFPEAFEQVTSPKRAVRDIALLESLSVERPFTADVFYDDDGSGILLRQYERRDVYLSDILPVLEAFGLVVMDSYATNVHTRAGDRFLDSFRLKGASGLTDAQLIERAPLLVDAIEAVFSGKVTSDALNALVLSSGLSWRQVDVLRAYVRYGRQLQIKLSMARAFEILKARPHVAKLCVDLFDARFHPDLTGTRDLEVAAAQARVADALRSLRTHDEDLLFRTIANLIGATVRTNTFRDDRKGHYLSFKLDCAKVDAMVRPRPKFEIYVHSAAVEGVHLRFGNVARGGLRWSDREDYRTEVLGLARTQVVKNVLIVPVGAKGGFLLKQASHDAAERRRQADELYQVFIRGLLDVTDNAVNGAIVPPPRVVRHDADDPYLVVAADKGTAHLSDTANKLSLEYGFWLGDAFASGGSNGYDHKKVGITARGGWVLVKRLFAEIGKDPYRDPIDVVGIGDLSGDVFGNGLIESTTLRLRAAFNHAHIFLDPNPDAGTSFTERKRLFDAGRLGGWDQYDTSLLSAGGGVFDRTAKAVSLSPEVQAMLGIATIEAPPETVIRHILRMEADLLWNGGIGTYVKATKQTDADVDDRANDALRVNASDLRVKVVGEGGNLGFTQDARIEAALYGVRLNTDFVDNSGGVDLSDHEVNLKILLDRVVARGDLTIDARNALLEEMTDEVARLVLADNDQQGRQISRDVIRSASNLADFGRAIAFVEKELAVTRDALRLPTEEELTRRRAEGIGLTRPELAVLSSWVKMYVFRELMAGRPKDLPGYAQLLTEYFPARIRERYPDDINGHMLADEIAMTVATNRIVADAGASFFPIVAEKTGRPVQEAAIAYLTAQRLARTAEVRATLEELRSSVQLSLLSRAWVQIDAGTRQVATYWLGARERVPTAEEVVDMTRAVDQLWEIQGAAFAERHRKAVEELLAAVPTEVAARVHKAAFLNSAIMVWAEAKRAGATLLSTAATLVAVGQATRLQDVLDDLANRPADGRWDPIALNILFNRFNRLLRDVLAAVPIAAEGAAVADISSALGTGMLRPLRFQVDSLLQAEDRPSVATLLVLEERVAGEVARLPAPT